ncbi:imelysin [Bacteriovorax sp. BSW11_IV]|uniref:imelysin family protein n=1 Tax=Bacteriovorax sp. BSW11_IV TaxID=1353529 RepID=UPI000389E67B|nr:imelysin family protein [Bacteriovorax sp. BSW11_IV]EQC49007.1 imelysin [Bacteriovorax sp. BSW11_IV]
MKNIIINSLILLGLVSSSFASSTSEEALKTSIKGYSDHVYGQYVESLDRAKVLRDSLKLFTDAPSVMTQEMAKKAWISAREVYGQTEVFRFYGGPIDNDEGPEGLLNAWPLDEAYIDYVEGAPNAGIINNVSDFPEITKELLTSLNELDGEKNVSTGYHAIEFLLWGQDMYADGAGRRSYEDYIEAYAPNAKRRSQYLNIAADLLVEHLSSLVEQWSDNKNNYRTTFESDNKKETLKKILSGLIFMAGDELSGERMYVAYETMGQEDEHSCFSDMTHMDIIWNYLGLENVITATGVLELPELKGSALVSQVKERMATVNKLLHSIPAPFDQAILSEEGRAIILSSVEELELLAAELVKVSEVLGAKVDF